MPKQHRIRILIGAVVVAMITMSVVFYIQKNSKSVLQISPKEQTAATQSEPKKIDFGTNVPVDFPTNIPIEKGAQVEQSYGLNYFGQKQLTIVFLSTKTVKENYSLYASFLKNQDWHIVNTYESAKLSSLYGTKESNDINVTISENTSTTSVKSQISISVLKK